MVDKKEILTNTINKTNNTTSNIPNNTEMTSISTETLNSLLSIVELQRKEIDSLYRENNKLKLGSINNSTTNTTRTISNKDNTRHPTPIKPTKEIENFYVSFYKNKIKTLESTITNLKTDLNRLNKKYIEGKSFNEITSSESMKKAVKLKEETNNITGNTGNTSNTGNTCNTNKNISKSNPSNKETIQKQQSAFYNGVNMSKEMVRLQNNPSNILITNNNVNNNMNESSYSSSSSYSGVKMNFSTYDNVKFNSNRNNVNTTNNNIDTNNTSNISIISNTNNTNTNNNTNNSNNKNYLKETKASRKSLLAPVNKNNNVK